MKEMLKRAFDVVVASCGLVLLSPVLIWIACLVAWRMGWPVIFVQQRPGRAGRPFYMFKFRTMTDQRDANGDLLPNADRLTPFGQWLRATSLDELPELLNVIRGDMSLVGPRPLLMAYLDHYTPEQYRRHEVRPGITGWAQVNGRNALDWDEKLAMDVWYVDNRSFLVDMKILFRTVSKVIKREGVETGDGGFMPRFDTYMKQKTGSK